MAAAPSLRAELQPCADQLPKAALILPNAAADGDQANADSYIRKDVSCSLHGVGDREERILVLFPRSNDQNSGSKTDQLNEQLHPGEMADPAAKRKMRLLSAGAQQPHRCQATNSCRRRAASNLQPGDQDKWRELLDCDALPLPVRGPVGNGGRSAAYCNTRRTGSNNTPATKYRRNLESLPAH